MKIKNLLAAVTAVFGLATMAQAQTTVYIAGAPALRTELTTAIENLLIGLRPSSRPMSCVGETPPSAAKAM
jgi:hypothetical protein